MGNNAHISLSHIHNLTASNVLGRVHRGHFGLNHRDKEWRKVQVESNSESNVIPHPTLDSNPNSYFKFNFNLNNPGLHEVPNAYQRSDRVPTQTTRISSIYLFGKKHRKIPVTITSYKYFRSICTLSTKKSAAMAASAV